jgi:tetratricopeptide (TPR) repeat protein
MSKMQKDIQDELRKDEVAETLQRIGENIQAYRNLLITMAIIIVAGVLITFGLRSHQETVARESNAMLAGVIQRYEGLVSQPDAKQREDLLKQLVDSANSLADTYPDTKLGREALYIKGNAYYQMDRFVDAEKAYKAYLEKAANDEEKARGEIALGYTAENWSFMSPAKERQEKVNAALDHYTKAASLAEGGDKAHPAYPYLYYYAVICQARVNELLPGKTKEAMALYEEVLKNRPEPVVKSEDKEARGEQDMLMQFVRRQLDEVSGQMSLQATAKMRLDRLKSAPLSAPPVMTEVKASAAPASAPAVKAGVPAAVKAPAQATAKPAATAAPTAKPTAAPTAAPVQTAKPAAPVATQAAKPVATAAPTAKPAVTPAPTQAAKPAAPAAPAAKPSPVATQAAKPAAAATPAPAKPATPAAAQAATSASKPNAKP